MIQVSLIAKTDMPPLESASHSALRCYQAKPPTRGKVIDVFKKLFKTSHHTTLQHFSATFGIEGIAVGDVTFGAHLCSPFYNSDQRSGRYCAEMFINPNWDQIREYITQYWPEVSEASVTRIMAYVQKWTGRYHQKIEEATKLAAQFLTEERPNASAKYIAEQAPKIAQEQMRAILPIIYPTGLDFTVNLSAIVALWESAFTPAMRHVTDQMVSELRTLYPELEPMFDPERRRKTDWSVPLRREFVSVETKPLVQYSSIEDELFFTVPDPEDMHPVDRLHFTPELMNNNIGELSTSIVISTGTMAQDHRHRKIRRGQPSFCGSFYLPPILDALNMHDAAETMLTEWLEISKLIPGTLAQVLTPYGSMITYRKKGSFNAILHEQAKRGCLCSQEEIFTLSRIMRSQIQNTRRSWLKDDPIMNMFEPPCQKTGKCAEGDRFCGRDMKGEFPTKRRV